MTQMKGTSPAKGLKVFSKLTLISLMEEIDSVLRVWLTSERIDIISIAKSLRLKEVLSS